MNPHPAKVPLIFRQAVIEDASAVNDSGTSILQLLAPVLAALLNRLRDLFRMGLRSFLVGRRRTPTRFHWHMPLKDMLGEIKWRPANPNGAEPKASTPGTAPATVGQFV